MANNYTNKTQEEINEHFMYSAFEFDFETMVYLLTSPDLPYNAQIDYEDCLLVRRIVSLSSFHSYMEKCFPILDFLFNSPRIDKHIDIHHDQDWLIVFSSANKQLPLMKYLLTSPTLNEHANVHAKNDIVFRNACSDNNTEMIHYLIFDYGITLTETIENEVKYERPDIYKLFEKRELEKNLQSSLKEQSSIKNHKI